MNEPPLADFNVSSQLAINTPIQLADLSKDEDGEVVKWYWDFGNGTTSLESDPTVTYAEYGAYTISLKVEDNFGARDSLSKKIELIEENLPPELVFELTFSDPLNDTSFYVGSLVTITDKSTDPNNENLSFQWSVNGISSSSSEQNIDEKGEIDFYVRVEDDHGAFQDSTFQLDAVGVDFKPWQSGYFDIHHINTGRGDAHFFIFPDGTTLLYDAGDKHVPGENEPDYPIHPNNTKVPGEWIVDYIKHITKHYREPAIDYAVISHFHVDHAGRINDSSPRSSAGYKLGGMTQVGDLMTIHKITDRGYPDYDFPVDLANDRDDTENYLSFLDYHIANSGLEVFKFKVGANDQIVPVINPATSGIFEVRNIYANGIVWTGSGDETENFEFDEPLVNESGEWNGNPLSICLKFQFGAFDYFTGGDITGDENWPDYDIETIVGQNMGEVDALALNHHGFKDATNDNFLNATQPKVLVQQASNFAHVNGEVLGRITRYGDADLFTSNMSSFFADSPSVRNLFRSISGHVVIRVVDGGAHYKIFILNDHSPAIPAMRVYGPYTSKN